MTAIARMQPVLVVQWVMSAVTARSLAPLSLSLSPRPLPHEACALQTRLRAPPGPSFAGRRACAGKAGESLTYSFSSSDNKKGESGVFAPYFNCQVHSPKTAFLGNNDAFLRSFTCFNVSKDSFNLSVWFHEKKCDNKIRKMRKKFQFNVSRLRGKRVKAAGPFRLVAFSIKD